MILDVGLHDMILIYRQASFIRFRNGLILTEWSFKVMRFEVGDLVRNYIGDLLITVDAGRDYIACKDKPRKFQYATFHNVDGQEYTIWAHHANWKQHKVVANG